MSDEWTTLEPHFDEISVTSGPAGKTTEYIYAKDGIGAMLVICEHATGAPTALVELSTDSVQYRGYLTYEGLLPSDGSYAAHYVTENDTETEVQRAAIPALLDLISGTLMKAFKVDIRDAGCLQAFVREYARD